MKEAKCRRCGINKQLSIEFYSKEKRNKSGFSGTCKVCVLKSARKGDERRKKQTKPDLKTLVCTKCGEEKEVKFFHKHSRSTTGYKCACKACRMLETHKYNKREETRERARTRRKQDPVWKLRKNVSIAIVNSLRKRGGQKEASCFQYLGYSVQDLREHLEKQFEPWMSWDNWGPAGSEIRTWNIDHIYPQSLLPYDSLGHPNFQKCWDLRNLQPLCTIENIKKSNKILDR